jgi:molybdopterin-guanine dinucleotide biosynthesis protein A
MCDLRLSAVILAGGESRRMGRDKAWLTLDGEPLITRAIQLVRALGPVETFISGRADVDYSALNCPVLHDLIPGLGPLGAIERALHACRSPLLLVLAVDLPHMTTAFLASLVARARAMTGVVPLRDGSLEPLAATYPRRCHEMAFRLLAQSRHCVRDFAEACLQEGAVRTLRVARRDARCFINWNSPVDVTLGRGEFIDNRSALRNNIRIPALR